MSIISGVSAGVEVACFGSLTLAIELLTEGESFVLLGEIKWSMRVWPAGSSVLLAFKTFFFFFKFVEVNVVDLFKKLAMMAKKRIRMRRYYLYYVMMVLLSLNRKRELLT